MRSNFSRFVRQLSLAFCIGLFLSAVSSMADAQTAMAEIVSFSLIDADKDEPISAFDPIQDGAEIDISLLPTLNLNILANFSNGRVGSIAFDYDDSADYLIDNVQPFSLQGDERGDFHSWTPSLGSHRVQATIYEQPDKGGQPSNRLAISFTITSSAENISPAVNVRSDATMTLPTNSTVINGYATDPDGNDENMQILWSAQDVPPGADLPTMSGVNSTSLFVEDLVLGTYRFRLNVIDEYGDGNFADAYVYVYAPENQPPVVDAGDDIDISLPIHSTTVYASAVDDGSIVKYEWVQTDGPLKAQTNGSTGPTLTVSGLDRVGGYVFELTVTDDGGATASDTVVVSVNPDPTNLPATVTASEDFEMLLPDNSAELSAQAIDNDGFIQGVEWYKKSGPAVTISPTNTLTTTISNLQAGNYVFRVLVFDNSGNATSESVNVTVIGEPNEAPSVDVGEDYHLIFPNNSLEISSISADVDGSISSYVWTQVEGPAAILWDTDSATLRLTDMTVGNYTFKLTVYDDDGATASDTVQVAVTNQVQVGSAQISGDLVKWHPLTLSFSGPTANEDDDSPNPFLDFRLTVDFKAPSGATYRVPGFFAGDGSGGASGDQWQVRFSADEVGEWLYVAHFDAGSNIAINLNLATGLATSFDMTSGTFTISERAADAPGFLSQGRLQYVGEHYLKSAEGGFWIKGGTGSPENMLGYAGFDNTVDQGHYGSGMTHGVHRFSAHIDDWNEGDPLWLGNNSYGNVDSKGIIGALNYLASQDVNSISVMPLNLGGDGQETYPFTQAFDDHFSKTHYDLSKLAQWNQFFGHAQRQAMQVQFIFADDGENISWLDQGSLDIERKLFYREMMARYGYLLGVKWNLGEGFVGDLGSIASHIHYLEALNWADHPIAVNSVVDDHQLLYAELAAPDALPLVDISSLQYPVDLIGDNQPQSADSLVEDYRVLSADLGHKWVIDLDENKPEETGLTSDNIDALRKRVLYAVLFSGGNLEWYSGHNLADIELENYRDLEPMWQQMAFARNFMLNNLPFWAMDANDQLLSYGRVDGQVFMQEGVAYAIYLPEGLVGDKTAQIDLSADSERFTQQWFNPRTGQFIGRKSTVNGGSIIDLGNSPQDEHEDWVILLQNKTISESTSPQVNPANKQSDDTTFLSLTAICLLLMAGVRKSVVAKMKKPTFLAKSPSHPG